MRHRETEEVITDGGLRSRSELAVRGEKGER